jgi:hypothetical protein
MSRAKGIGPRLTELARQVLEEAAGHDDPKFRLDSFKALTTFHIGVTRAEKNLPEEPDEGSIMSIKERIAASQREGHKKDTWVKRQLDDATNNTAELGGGVMTVTAMGHPPVYFDESGRPVLPGEGE